MNEVAHEQRDHWFLTGLLAGGVFGAGLALWLAPRAVAEIKGRAADSVRNLKDAVSERARDARSHVTDAVEDLTRTGQGVRDGVCDTVVRGARNVEVAARDVEIAAQDVQRFAAGAKTRTEE